ncbi:hypothetical protein TRIUR3_14352 [Triticum urartu]|uniref:FLZ-type domain-containing protein n=1 Tax=Triticum urartu TaxID=4572 RepID=M7ZTU5_TRIUA|nr:hypothetical protein TRIUR3_14352 [Triticum urartu]
MAACAFFFDAEPLGEPGLQLHGPELELDACALCTKPLQGNNDIFIRGATSAIRRGGGPPTAQPQT